MSLDFSYGSMLGFAGNALGSVLGGFSSRRAAKKEQDRFNQQVALQREFAQNSIRWRVNDAKAAGIHPLAALGVSASQYHPVSTSPLGGQDFSWLGNSLESMGQNIDRAREAGMTKEARLKAEALADRQTALALENQELQNEVLRTELWTKRFRVAQQATVAIPRADGRSSAIVPGQAQTYPTGLTEEKNPEVYSSLPGRENIQAGENPDIQFLKTREGYSLQKSDSAKNLTDDETLATLAWYLRNWVAAQMGNYSPKIRRSFLPQTPEMKRDFKDWYFNPLTMEYTPRDYIPVNDPQEMWRYLRVKFGRKK